MKKHHLIFIAAFMSICLIACNGNSNNENKNPGDAKTQGSPPPDPCAGIDDIDICKDAGGVANIVIEATEARKMMTNFESIFKTEGGIDIRAFEPVYWLDKCEIYGIENFLKTQIDPTTKKKYDGIRIFMACETTPNPIYGADRYKQRTTVFIFPTIPRAPVIIGKSDHVTKYVKIGLMGTCISPFLQDYAIAYPQTLAFEKLYRKTTLPKPDQKDSLSSSIWVDSCVIFTLAKLLRLPNAQIDGANINMAAYDKYVIPTTPVRGRFKDIQTTVILVPTHIENGQRKDYWQIVDCLFNHAKSMGWVPPGGFNHGELCPQQCE